MQSHRIWDCSYNQLSKNENYQPGQDMLLNGGNTLQTEDCDGNRFLKSIE